MTTNQKISFRYNQLDSSSNSLISSSSSAGIGRRRSRTNWMTYQNGNYALLENIKSGIGEWNWIINSSLANNLIVGLTSNDESRGDVGNLFPFVDILEGGVGYASFGTEPFSVQNELRYKTFQLQDSLTKYGKTHTFTFGFTTQRYHSDNVFWSCCPQSNYTYNSLADFYTDANDFLRNPNRTVSPVTLRRFKVRYSNVPDLEKPLQPLQVWYSGGYAQDEWRPRKNLTVTGGPPARRVGVQEHRVSEREGRRADVPRRGRAACPVQDRRDARPEDPVVATRGDELGHQQRPTHAGARRAPASSQGRRSTCGFPTSWATQVC